MLITEYYHLNQLNVLFQGILYTEYCHLIQLNVYFRGSKLATSSGDTTVKVWDFSKAECVHTFTDHTHAGRLTTLTVYCEIIFIR